MMEASPTAPAPEIALSSEGATTAIAAGSASASAAPTPGEVVEERTAEGMNHSSNKEDDGDDDDDEEYQHDQLPSVEEVRTRAASYLAESEQRHRSTRRVLSGLSRPSDRALKILFWIGSLLLLVAAVVLIVGVTVLGRRGRRGAPNLKQGEAQGFLIDHGYASAQDFEDPASPRSQAVHWMVSGDGAGGVYPEDSDPLVFAQRYILTVLYFSTSGDEWTKTWGLLDPDKPTCHWNRKAVSDAGEEFLLGASCGDGYVSVIQLPQNDLAGTLPMELGFLTDLTFLALHHNSIEGTLPSEFKALTNMDYFAIHYNQLYGNAFPDWMTSWTRVRVLGLGNNAFDGTIPSFVGKFSNLVTLGLDDNDFSGDLENIQDLKKLKRLYLNSNRFSGSLENVYLLAMRDLEELDLSDNQFVGTIPIDLFQYPKLRILDLSVNQLNGLLPLGVYGNPTLRYVALNNNQLEGAILESFADMRNLTHLDLSSNLFTGFIPSSITDKLTFLKYLFFSENPTLDRAPLPDLTRLTNLEDVSFKSTNRTGPLPEELCKTVELLKLLDLDDNSLTGSIPASWGTDCLQLRYLFLNRNDQLGGTVPTSIQNLPHLKILLLAQTGFVGNLDPMCSRSNSISALEVTSADCHPSPDGEAELECDCCAICCSDDPTLNDASCKENIFYGNLDPEWENSFFRKNYDFKVASLPTN